MSEETDNNQGQTPIHVLEVLGNAIVGGMESHVSHLIQQLPPDQFRITCLCPYESTITADLRRLGCQVFTTAMDHDPPLRSIQAAVTLIRGHQVDLIHAHLPKAHVLAGLAGCLTQTPVVATIHGMTLSDQELGISNTTDTHLILVCREALVQAQILGVPAERLTFIPNGVDLTTFVPGTDGTDFRTCLGLPPEALLVGFVGRLSWEKGPDQFVRMAKYVHHRQPETHFVLVGDGPLRDDVLHLIQELNLEDHVHLAGVRTDAWAVYPAFDVLVQTSRIEGTPLVLLEAMACGRPVVAMGVGGVIDLVEVDTTGFLAAAGDWEGVGEALIPLLNQPQKRTQMGQAGRQRAEKLFDLRSGVQLTSELFRCLAHSRPDQFANKPTPWPLVSGGSQKYGEKT